MCDSLDYVLHFDMEKKVILEEIAKKSKVKVRWFYDFINKKVKEPGVHKVQRIFDYLSK